MIVDLTDEEVEWYLRVGDTRLRDALAGKMQDRFGSDSLTSHHWGAGGELATAKSIGVPWRGGSKEGRRADVGRYEVRTVRPGTRWYAKSKKGDVPFIASVQMLSKSRADIRGWIERDTLRRLGTYEDLGKRGAFAWFLRDPSALHPDFPEWAALPNSELVTPTPRPAPPIVLPDGRSIPIVRLPDGRYEYQPRR